MTKRDLDRFREIIIHAVETRSEHDDGFTDFSKTMKSGDEYQLYLMAGAGLIEGPSTKEGFFFVTNEGHDFYDAIKSEGIWNETKKVVAETGGNATLEIIKALATGFIRKQIERLTDFEL